LHIGHLVALIEVERLAKQGFLIAEAGIEAGLGDAHRLGQFSHRGAFVATRPEHLQRRRQRLIRAKLTRAPAGGATGSTVTTLSSMVSIPSGI
jgi:hypothetical protein